jgi:hypothetical protein
MYDAFWLAFSFPVGCPKLDGLPELPAYLSWRKDVNEPLTSIVGFGDTPCIPLLSRRQ